MELAAEMAAGAGSCMRPLPAEYLSERQHIESVQLHQRRMLRLIALAATCTLLLTSCSTEGKYQPPSVASSSNPQPMAVSIVPGAAAGRGAAAAWAKLGFGQ